MHSSWKWAGTFIIASVALLGMFKICSRINGDPSESEKMFRLCLKRTIKTGVHETGHILSMFHCIENECCMNGSNHRLESDSHPLWLCPVCLRKLCYAVQTDPVQRFEKLGQFCKKHSLKNEEAFFRKSAEAIIKVKEGGHKHSIPSQKPDAEENLN